MLEGACRTREGSGILWQSRTRAGDRLRDDPAGACASRGGTVWLWAYVAWVGIDGRCSCVLAPGPWCALPVARLSHIDMVLYSMLACGWGAARVDRERSVGALHPVRTEVGLFSPYGVVTLDVFHVEDSDVWEN
eukprot:3090113-Prymnesium_polylepis.1